MRPHCYLAWSCLLMTLAGAAVVPTTETFVVSRSDEPTTELLSSSNASDVSDPTTEGPTPPLKLTEMDVKSVVTMRYAHTAVVTRMRNPANRAQEATFRVLLPETAFISGFTMTLDGKEYKAYVKEKEEAKQIYNEAVSHGFGAAHVVAKARDSNHFTVSVNVEPNSNAIFNLTYEELLIRRNGVYNHAINLHPGTLVPKLTVTVQIKERQKLTVLRVPDVRTGNEVDATEEDAQNSKAVITKSKDVHEAIITFTPDLDEQKRLMGIYAEKTKESMSHSNRWYGDEEEPETDGILGQFVVQYDVDRPKDGEILVNDGYFVHFYSPSSLPPLNKYVVFVLDTSGSMLERKIEQLREAMQTILSKLNKGDYFSIVEFASSVKVHDVLGQKDSQDDVKIDSYLYYQQDKPTTLVPPVPATPENIAKAKTIVSKLSASGGTNIAGALDVAVQLINKGIGWTQSSNQSEVASSSLNITEVIETTPKSDATNDSAKKPAAEAPAKKEEKKTDDDTQKPEPIIIFLTDGDPTVGETDPKRIITHLSEKNYGENKASIFSLAFGEDADRSFLRKLSLRNEGFMRHIYEAADAALQLRDFYQQVSSPLLSHVKFVYSPEQVKEDSLTKRKFRTIYAGGETIVAGRLTDDSVELSPQLQGFCGVQDGVGRKLYEVSTKVAVSRTKQEWLPLERLWAYLTIKQLLDERDAAEIADKPTDKETGPEKKALNIALKYSFVTPLTSLVVVKPNATKAVDAESVDKKSGLSNYAPLMASGFARPSLYGPPGAPGSPASFAFAAAPAHSYSLHSSQYASQDLSLLPESIQLSDDLDIEDYTATKDEESNITTDDTGIFGLTTPVPHIPTTSNADASVAETATNTSDNAATSPLAPYHLETCSWAQPLLQSASDELLLNVNGTAVHLKLTKNADVPKSASGDEVCPHAIGESAEEGVCVYLTRCEASKELTADTYVTTYCTVNNEFAGVCCPKTKVEQSTS